MVEAGSKDWRDQVAAISRLVLELHPGLEWCEDVLVGLTCWTSEGPDGGSKGGKRKKAVRVNWVSVGTFAGS